MPKRSPQIKTQAFLANLRTFLSEHVDPMQIERDARIRFGDVHDKLLRASEGLEYSRELIASVRDYQQARVASEQNETAQKLAVIASLLLFPTFIVGVYGQNFEHMPELGWRLGYVCSWGLILVSVVALLAGFRWRRWI